MDNGPARAAGTALKVIDQKLSGLWLAGLDFIRSITSQCKVSLASFEGSDFMCLYLLNMAYPFMFYYGDAVIII